MEDITSEYLTSCLESFEAVERTHALPSVPNIATDEFTFPRLQINSLHSWLECWARRWYFSHSRQHLPLGEMSSKSEFAPLVFSKSELMFFQLTDKSEVYKLLFERLDDDGLINTKAYHRLRRFMK